MNDRPGVISGIRLDVVIRIAGGPGDGVGAAGRILTRAAVLMGFHVLAQESRPAEIRGFGKTIASVRISQSRHHSSRQHADILLSLDDSRAIPELAALAEQGAIFYDNRPRDFIEEDQAIAGFVTPGRAGYGVPLRELSEQATGGARSRGLVALGALAAMHRMPREPFYRSIQQRFVRGIERYLEESRRAFDLGFEFAERHLVKADRIDFDFQTVEREGQLLLLSGNEAVAQAIIDARLRLFAMCPAAPVNGIAEILARELPALGGQVLQAEDDASAIAHVLGAGFAGCLSATATSGAGLGQMTELLGLAVMAEIPLLVIHGQRGGPSVGLPGRTEQSDLRHAIFGGNGDCSRPVLAPTDVAECYCLTGTALQLAATFQTPVVLLLDGYLATCHEDVPWQPCAPYCSIEATEAPPLPAPDEYRRYRVGPSGISPVSVPGQAGYGFTATGMEHDECGIPSDSGPNHAAMAAKRHRKLEVLARAWPPPETAGPEGLLELGVIAWGPVAGAAREALADLAAGGIAAGGLFPRLMWPVQAAAFRGFAEKCRILAVVELNFYGQFADLVELAVGRPVCRIVSLEGESLSPEWVFRELGRLLGPNGDGPRAPGPGNEESR